MRSRLGRGGDAKQEAALQEGIKTLQHKEGKLQGEGRQAGRVPLLAPRICSSTAQPHPPSGPAPPAVSAQTYAEQEALLHRDFSTLIADAAWLRSYGERRSCTARQLLELCSSCHPATHQQQDSP